MLRFSCEKCGASYSVADEAAGKPTKCAKCGATMRVPSADVLAGAAEMPPAKADPADPMAALQAALSAEKPSSGPADKPAPSAVKPPAAPKPAVPAPVAPATVVAPQPVAPAPVVVPQPVAPAPAVQPPAAVPQPVAPAPVAPGPVVQALGEPVWQEAVPVDVPGEPEWQDVVPIDAPPAGQQISDDGIPMARPAKRKLWPFITIGVVAAVLLAAGVGVVLFFPSAYDIAQLKASFREAKGQAAQALPAGTVSFDGLDEKVMVDGIESLKGAVAKFKALDKELSKLEQYQSEDSALRELASAAGLVVLTEERRLKALENELWPRPGGVGDMYDRMKASVPLIESMHIMGRRKGMSIASGFLIKPEGLGYLLVTNRHVVQDGGDGFTVRFLTEDKRSTDKSDDIKLKPADVVHIHRHEDLAILRFPEDTWPTIERMKVHPLAIARELKVGRSVWAVGNPGSGTEGILLQALVKGDVSAIVEDKAENPVLFRFTAPVNKGNSGGPVLDSAGRVVGVVSRGVRGKNAMNFAVHYRKLNELTDLMAGRRSDANLISLDTREIGLIVDPLRNLPKDLDPAVEKWSKIGFQRVKWLGRDSKSYFILPLPSAMPGTGRPVLPTIVRKFKATKGNTYSIVVVSGRISAVDFSVKAPGAKKPVYTRSGDGTSKAKVAKGEEFREDFVAEKDGTYEVRFVRSMRPEELKGSVPQKIAVCACVVEQKALEWRGDESSE